jgi:hypothetical protein
MNKEVFSIRPDKYDYRAFRKQTNEVEERGRIKRGAHRISCLHTGMIADGQQTDNWLF